MCIGTHGSGVEEMVLGIVSLLERILAMKVAEYDNIRAKSKVDWFWKSVYYGSTLTYRRQIPQNFGIPLATVNSIFTLNQ